MFSSCMCVALFIQVVAIDIRYIGCSGEHDTGYLGLTLGHSIPNEQEL